MIMCSLVLLQPDFFYAVTDQTNNASGLNYLHGLFDNLYQVVATFISGIGMLVALYNVAEIGGAWMGHGNGGAQFEAFKRMGGSLVWVAAPQLIMLFGYF